jgi:hypothetical protein
LLGLLELGLQPLGGNRCKHGGADSIRGHLRIQQGLADGLKALEGGPNHGAVPLRSRIERVLGSAIRGRHKLGVHVDELIERLAIEVAEKTDDKRIALGGEESPQAVGTRLRHLPRKGGLEIIIEPSQVEAQHTRRVNLVQLVEQPQEGACGRYKHGQNISYMDAEIIGSYFEEMLQTLWPFYSATLERFTTSPGQNFGSKQDPFISALA